VCGIQALAREKTKIKLFLEQMRFWPGTGFEEAGVCGQRLIDSDGFAALQFW
jgi:hypothetical protein